LFSNLENILQGITGRSLASEGEGLGKGELAKVFLRGCFSFSKTKKPQINVRYTGDTNDKNNDGKKFFWEIGNDLGRGSGLEWGDRGGGHFWDGGVCL
jgi:hypothetical protein